MESLSVEEENNVRMSLLLTGISPRAVRTFFDSEFPPACLEATMKKEYNKLFDLKKKHRIHQSQWNLLFPRSPAVPDSKTFDMTLMITLLRNLTPLNPPLVGFDRLPSAMETSPASDLARIKYYRSFLAHLDYGKLYTTYMTTAWTDMIGAICRLGGTQMKLECDHLKTKPLDQTNQDVMMDIKRSNDEIRVLKESQYLQEDHRKVTKEMEILESTLSEKEENYVRMSFLLTGISPRAVRTFFDSAFAPAYLEWTIKKEYNKLFELKKKHRINQSQWNLLFPRLPDVPDSKTFDLTLMILLLQFLTPLTPPLYGFDRLPSDMEITPAADLARIKHYRNYLAHLDEGKLDIGSFNTAWNDITCAIHRLGGTQMKLECDHLKTKSLDQTNQEVIKQSNDEIKLLKESYKLLQEDHRKVTKEMEILKSTLNDTVPWNIRGMNGDIHSNSTPCPAAPDTGQIQELEEERKILQQQLSNMPEPAVSEVESRSALIQLAPPEYDQSEFEIDPEEFRYELLLSDKGKEGKYKLVYSGDATEITLKDLKPATDYFLRVCTSLEEVKGKPTKAVQFTTGTCEPDAPVPPKLSSTTKTSITLKWNATCENGSKVTTYMLDYDKGLGDGFVEVYNGLQRHHRVSKLQASTKYMFRVAAINNVGKSQYSEPVAFYTCGSVPNLPDVGMYKYPATSTLQMFSSGDMTV